jgi:membrane-associated phospholipid phosphatase
LHYPSDVLAGAAISACLAQGAIAWSDRRLAPGNNKPGGLFPERV